MTTPRAFKLFWCFIRCAPSSTAPNEIELKTVVEEKDNGGVAAPTTTTSATGKISKEELRDLVRRSILVFLLVLITLFMACACSLIGPFLPIEASEKGSNAITTGIIIGACPLSVVILCPFIGYYLPVVGVKFSLVMGTALLGGAFFLMAFLVDMPSGAVFVVFGILLRLTEGVGWALSRTAIIALLPYLFPSHLGLMTGLILGTEGLGFAIGPPTGGFLVSIYNYRIPFLLFGGITILLAPLPLPLLKTIETPTTELLPVRLIVKFHNDMMFSLLLLSSIVAQSVWAFVEATLALFLSDQIGFNQFQIGLVFVAGSSSYVISSLVAGKVSDACGSRGLIIAGLFAGSIALFLLTLTPIISTVLSKWTVLIPMSVFGCSTSLVDIPVYPDLIRQAKLLGLTTDDQKDALNSSLSGLIAFSMSVGEFIGAVMGGILTYVADFPTAALIVGEIVAANAFMVLGVSLIDCIFKRNQPTSS